MATLSGPSSGTAELFLGQTAGIEVQVPAGLPSLGPAQAPFVDPQSAYSGTVVNKTVVGIQVSIPA